MFDSLETPCLILDQRRLQRNADAMRTRAADLDVALRPHLKTSKSDQVGRVAKGGELSGITVSTLKEAEYFANAGYVDILLAVSITPNKFARVAALTPVMGEPLLVVTDSAAMARHLADYATRESVEMVALIEIDCGEHRSGLGADDPTVVEIAKILDKCPKTQCRGVMTHGGHSYSCARRDQVVVVAEAERAAAVDAAQRIRDAGMQCPVVSVGSTPTVMWAEQLAGVTEVRCGIYLFWDLAQLSRRVCTLDDIAMTVLATVIGHNRAVPSLVLDAGGLALSKDTGANQFLPDAKLGYVCDAVTGQRHGNLSVDIVHQEHGTVMLDSADWLDRIPIGSQVRIVPNHACMTAAPYDCYHVFDGEQVTGRWERISGW